ncbi:hypothetical protein [Nocardiopsis potens]|uniref:hypothetical protein n=1 Tax=Nocardiopsis potens TaxID=1246458 RepID=UPI00034D345E|nr:hypothetical protein [Nocardiopsis potens]
MDIDHQEYLDALVLTKGASGWRFLFCGITEELRETYDFETASERMKTMLDVFPELFPGHDHSGLRAVGGAALSLRSDVPGPVRAGPVRARRRRSGHRRRAPHAERGSGPVRGGRGHPAGAVRPP